MIAGIRPRAETLILLGNSVSVGTLPLLDGMRSQWKDIVVVPGPYESDDRHIQDVIKVCKDLDMIWLNNRAHTLGRSVFIGTTMWPRALNEHWHEEDVETVVREVRAATGSSEPAFVFSYYRPSDPVQEMINGYVYRTKNPCVRWFYGSMIAPSSGNIGGVFTYGISASCTAAERDVVFSYDGITRGDLRMQ